MTTDDQNTRYWAAVTERARRGSTTDAKRALVGVRDLLGKAYPRHPLTGHMNEAIDLIFQDINPTRALGLERPRGRPPTRYERTAAAAELLRRHGHSPGSIRDTLTTLFHCSPSKVERALRQFKLTGDQPSTLHGVDEDALRQMIPAMYRQKLSELLTMT